MNMGYETYKKLLIGKTARCYQHRTALDISRRIQQSRHGYCIISGSIQSTRKTIWVLFLYTFFKEVDIMKIEKRGPDSYRVRKMYKGQMYTVTFDHKPTQKEALLALTDELQKVQKKHESMDFRTAAEAYIESKRNILSPATIRGYDTIMRHIPKAFSEKNIHDITAMDIQEEINRLAKERSPKTVRNYHGFISAVLSAFYPELKIPQKIKKSHISLHRMTSKRYWNAPMIQNLKFPSCWPAMDCAGQRYAPCSRRTSMRT